MFGLNDVRHNHVPFFRSEEREASRQACSASVIHQADKITRREIGKYLADPKVFKDLTPDRRKSLALALNSRRSALVDELKSGKILLPVSIEKAFVSEGDLAGLEEAVGKMMRDALVKETELWRESN